MPKALDLQRAAAKLRSFHHKTRRLPSFAELQALWGYASKGGVSHAVDLLIEKGVLARDPQGKLVPGSFLQGGLRVLGSVQAGFPSPAEEELIDTLTLDEFLVANREATYIVKVSGDSMIDAGILPGDLVIVERGKNPRPGDIVIAQVDGEWTMKYYEKRGAGVVLRAANKNYPLIHPKTELVIGGVVMANVRKYR